MKNLVKNKFLSQSEAWEFHLTWASIIGETCPAIALCGIVGFIEANVNLFKHSLKAEEGELVIIRVGSKSLI